MEQQELSPSRRPTHSSGGASRLQSPRCRRNPEVHRMGDHALFQSRSTARLFPAIARLSNDELAAMFHVPTVDPAEERMRELQYANAYSGSPVTFRGDDHPTLREVQERISSRPGTAGQYTSELMRTLPAPPQHPRRAFKIPAAATAKGAIALHSPSMFTGFDVDADVHGDTQRRLLSSREQQARISTPAGARRPQVVPFSIGPTAAAQSRIIRNAYLNDGDNEIAWCIREVERGRIKASREAAEMARRRAAEEEEEQRNRRRRDRSRREQFRRHQPAVAPPPL